MKRYAVAGLLVIFFGVIVPITFAKPPDVNTPVQCDKETGSALVVTVPPRDRVRYYAKRHLGIPYVWGGTSHRGFDCSGFVQHVFSHAGFCLPRTSSNQAYVSGASTRSWQYMHVADLVYWRTGHIAIYAGHWSGRYHIWESSKPGHLTERRPLNFRSSSWDRLAIPRHLNFKRLRRC